MMAVEEKSENLFILSVKFVKSCLPDIIELINVTKHPLYFIFR